MLLNFPSRGMAKERKERRSGAFNCKYIQFTWPIPFFRFLSISAPLSASFKQRRKELLEDGITGTENAGKVYAEDARQLCL